MQISAEISSFLTSPVTIIIGSSDRAKRPAIGRGLGIHFREPGQPSVIFSRWQWPRIAADVDENERLAVTCARPSDYVCYQLKGRARIRPADEDDAAHARNYCADIAAVLIGLGLSPVAVAQWTVIRELSVAVLEVDEAYVQTPGPRAGTGL